MVQQLNRTGRKGLIGCTKKSGVDISGDFHDQMIKQLIDEIVSHGDRGAVVPFARVDDLKQDMINLKNGDFHTDWLNRMA